MLRGKKIRLLPTPEQEILFWKSVGTSRWAYNYFLARNEEQYKTYLANGRKGKKSISEGVIRKEINNQLKPITHQWLKEVGSNVMKQAVKEAGRAMKKFLSGAAGRPKFKTKRRTTPRFYVNYESLTRKNGGFHGEKIGFVRTAEPLPKIPKGCHYSNPWISFDGKYWYIGFGYEVPDRLNVELTGDSIGIDLGVKELAVCYAFGERKKTVFKNINKTKEVHRLEKKLRREQRRQSRKFTANIDHYETVQRNEKKTGRRPIWKRPIRECRNIERQRQRIILLHRRLKNIRENHIHQTTAAIVKTKPSRIVMEDLNVKGMMKNRYLAKEIASEKSTNFAVRWSINVNRTASSLFLRTASTQVRRHALIAVISRKTSR